MFAIVCNTYCIIHCKIQIICLINSQKLITVQCESTDCVAEPFLNPVVGLFTRKAKLKRNRNKIFINNNIF